MPRAVQDGAAVGAAVSGAALGAGGSGTPESRACSASVASTAAFNTCTQEIRRVLKVRKHDGAERQGGAGRGSSSSKHGL